MAVGDNPNRYTEEMTGFLKSATRILSRPVVETAAPAASALYPPGQPPSLLIHVGEADPAQAAELRRQLPGGAILFLLHPPCSPEQEAAFHAAMPDSSRTLFCPLREDSFFSDKISMLVTILPEKLVRLVAGPGQRERRAAELRQIEEAIATALDNAQQERNRGLVRLRSSIQNLPSMAAHAGLRILRVPAGTPAIVCGAGPSLKTQYELLRQAKGRAVLIAVGHAAPTMIRAGIRPDVIVEVDAHSARNWPPGIRPDCLLVACTEVAPDVARRFERVFWCAGSTPAFNGILRRWGLVLHETPMAKSVTVPAIDFAVRLGCSRIALAGQEFCLSDSAVTHLDGETIEGGDEIVELPGNEGGSVRSTRNFASVREAIQGFLHMFNNSFRNAQNRPVVFNCTEGGAVIEGAARQPLSAFCAALPAPGPEWPLVERREREAFSVNRLDEAASHLKDYRAIADNVVDCCSRLRRELAGQPINVLKVRTSQRLLQQLVANEEAKRRDESFALWSSPIADHVDTVLKETPGLISSENNPEAQLTVLESRYGYLRDLSEDIQRELAQAGRRIKDGAAGNADAEAADPLVFMSFRQQGLKFIATENRDLAALLRKKPPVPDAARFDIRWMNQYVPFVKYRKADGAWAPLSGFVSMLDQAADAMDRFLAAQPVEAERLAMVFVAPGNWIYALDYARRHPQSDPIVIEPWLGLLSTLIDHGCFLHQLPRQTLIAGADEALPSWRALFQKRAAEIRKAGRTPAYFVSPALTDEPEIVKLLEELKSLEATS